MKKYLCLMMVLMMTTTVVAQEVTLEQRQQAWVALQQRADNYLLNMPWSAVGKNPSEFTVSRYNYAVDFPTPPLQAIYDISNEAATRAAMVPEEFWDYVLRVSHTAITDPYWAFLVAVGSVGAPGIMVYPKDFNVTMFNEVFYPACAHVVFDFEDEQNFRNATAMKLMSFCCKDQLFRDAYLNLCGNVLSSMYMYNMMLLYGYSPDPAMIVPMKAQIDNVNALLDDCEPLAVEINDDITQLYTARLQLTSDFLSLWHMLWACDESAP